MENYYSRMVENLGKLRRNEENMTPEQRKKYEKPLKRLKTLIANDATNAMHDFLIGGVQILKEDREGMEMFSKTLEKILAEDAEAVSKEAGRVLFTTYDVEKFLEAMIPLRNRIWYEAYGPVWLSHCRETGDPAYPYRNDIINMDWDAASNVWFDREEKSWTLMLPPTKQLLRKEYLETYREENGGAG